MVFPKRERQLRKLKRLRPNFGTCPICDLPRKELVVTKSQFGPLTLNVEKSCNHCALVLTAEMDHAVKILRADSFEIRKDLEK